MNVKCHYRNKTLALEYLLLLDMYASESSVPLKDCPGGGAVEGSGTQRAFSFDLQVQGLMLEVQAVGLKVLNLCVPGVRNQQYEVKHSIPHRNQNQRQISP